MQKDEETKDSGAALLPADPSASPASTEPLTDWRVARLQALRARYAIDATSDGLGSFGQSEALAYAVSLEHALAALALLENLATHPHNNYAHPANGAGQYGIGVTDGHRCVAMIIRKFFEESGSGTPSPSAERAAPTGRSE